LSINALVISTIQRDSKHIYYENIVSYHTFEIQRVTQQASWLTMKLSPKREQSMRFTTKRVDLLPHVSDKLTTFLSH